MLYLHARSLFEFLITIILKLLNTEERSVWLVRSYSGIAWPEGYVKCRKVLRVTSIMLLPTPLNFENDFEDEDTSSLFATNEHLFLFHTPFCSASEITC